MQPLNSFAMLDSLLLSLGPSSEQNAQPLQVHHRGPQKTIPKAEREVRKAARKRANASRRRNR